MLLDVFGKKGTGFEAIWFSESDRNMKEATGLWREEVAWTSNQHFCKQCARKLREGWAEG